MPTGYIYVINTLGRDYQQPLGAVPCFFEGRIYFGPCKKHMRPKMQVGDYVFGVSSSKSFPRRIVYAGRIQKRMTFAVAYQEFPRLRGSHGPIHVRPSRNPRSTFPSSEYEHIPGAIHATDWHADLRSPERDAFFVFEPAANCAGRWLGAAGPAINGAILEFLRQCAVFGARRLSEDNQSATETAPVRYHRLYTGLHLETDRPERLMTLVCAQVLPVAAGTARSVEATTTKGCVCGSLPPRLPRRSRC